MVLGPMDHIQDVPASFVCRSQSKGRVETSLLTLLYRCHPSEDGSGGAARVKLCSTHLMPVTVNGDGPCQREVCLLSDVWLAANIIE